MNGGELNTTVNKTKPRAAVMSQDEAAENDTQAQICLMDRFGRLHLTLCCDSRSILFTSQRVKRPGSAEVETLLGESLERWKGQISVLVTEEKQKPQHIKYYPSGPLCDGSQSRRSKQLFGCHLKPRKHQNKCSQLKSLDRVYPYQWPHYRLTRTRDQVLSSTHRPSDTKVGGGRLTLSHDLQAQRGCCWLTAFQHVYFSQFLQHAALQGPR